MFTFSHRLKKHTIAALLTAAVLAGCSREAAMSNTDVPGSASPQQVASIPMPAAPVAQSPSVNPQPGPSAEPMVQINQTPAASPSMPDNTAGIAAPSGTPVYNAPAGQVAYAPTVSQAYAPSSNPPYAATPPSSIAPQAYTSAPPTYAPAAAPYSTAPQPAYQPIIQQQYVLSDAQLDQLLAPVALYPDPLIAVMLPASTFPQDLSAAAQWLQYNPNPADYAIDAQRWEPTVKALAHTPSVLVWMNNNPDWTQTLGNAFANQPDDVMDSVQRLRGQAATAGALMDTPQQVVVYENSRICIEPAQPDVIYVPVYDWHTVYVRDRHPNLTFFAGGRVGAWFDFDFDWENRYVVVGARWDRGWDHRWDHDRNARPVNVRDNRPRIINNNDRTTINNTTINETRVVNVGGTRWQRDQSRPAPALPSAVKPAIKASDRPRQQVPPRDNNARRDDRGPQNVNTRQNAPANRPEPAPPAARNVPPVNTNTRQDTARDLNPASDDGGSSSRSRGRDNTPARGGIPARETPNTNGRLETPRGDTPDRPAALPGIQRPETPARGRDGRQNVATPAANATPSVTPDKGSEDNARERVVVPPKPRVIPATPSAPAPTITPSDRGSARENARGRSGSEPVVVPDATPRGGDRTGTPDRGNSEARGTDRATPNADRSASDSRAAGADRGRGQGNDSAVGNGRGRGND